MLVGALAADAAPVSPASYQALRWRMVGPYRGGRTRACAGVAAQPNVFYVAPVNGGVWKTDDAGRTWAPIFDGQPTQSIGSIAIAPSDPKVIYVGSGEGLLRPDLSVGDGVYRSSDGGKTWSHLGLDDAQQIPQLAVDPKNPDRVFAAVLGHPYGPNEQRGVFRSLDGGKTWQRVLFKGPNVGASDLAIDPKNPMVVYAALWEARLGPSEDGNEYEGTGGGLFKSTDGGTTWTQLKTGLPDTAVQFDLALAPSQPSTLYVALSTTAGGEYASGKGNGLFRSDDAGATWRAVTSDERPLMKIGGGDLMVPVVDPTDPNTLIVASIVAMKSTDGGKTWAWLRGAPGGDDYQNLWINPNDPRTFVLVSDQGAVVTVNGGATFSSWYNQPTAQLYHVAVTADVPYRLCSGQQESGSVCIASRGLDGTIGPREWRPVGVSEYGYAAPDPKDPDLIYGAGRSGVSRYRWSTHQLQDVSPIPVRGDYRVDRTQPIMFSPIRPDLLYYAANVLFQTTNGGQTWQTISPDLAHPNPGAPPSVGALAATMEKRRGTIYALAPSYTSVNTLWAGTDDGKVWTTRDGGKHWADITPPEVTPWSKVTQLDASRFDDTTVYASVSRLRVDDLAPFIYRTHDAGKTWAKIVAGLPRGPVNAVRADPVRKGLLYAATELGVFVSFDDGDAWQPLQQNLPHTSVCDLVVHGVDLIVATHGRGFWIMDDVSALRQLTPDLTDTLFGPAPAFRLPRSAYPDTPVPPDEPMAENPPTGAVIDYHLATAARDLMLEILDAQGAVVRTFSSDAAPELTAAELASQLIPSYWVEPERRLEGSPGMHRWVWDLRRERPRAGSYSYPINAAPRATPRTPEGARVAPGRYTARLTVDGKPLTAPLEVRLDPRITLPAKVIAQQNQLETRLAGLVDRSGELLLRAHSTLEQLGQRSTNDVGLKAQLASASAAATTLLFGGQQTPTPTLTSVAHTAGDLYRAVAVDAPPTAAQLAATTTVERELSVLAKAWTAFEAGELTRLGAALEQAGAPAIRPELKPQHRPSSGDEE